MRPFRSRPRVGRVVERLTGIPTRVKLASAACWLFNSEAMKTKALAARPDLERVAVAHPGIDDDLFRPAGSRGWQWRLLCLGRLDPRKGTHLALEAMVHLPDEATLVLQGSGDHAYVQDLKTKIVRLGLERRVTFSSEPRRALPAVYAAADAVLFPVQWEEPWGLVPLEAMAVGRPVVATGTGGSGEYLRHQENCLIYEPRDSAQALASAISRLANDAVLRQRLQTAGEKTAGCFTEAAYNDAIRTALEQAASDQRARGPGT